MQRYYQREKDPYGAIQAQYGPIYILCAREKASVIDSNEKEKAGN